MKIKKKVNTEEVYRMENQDIKEMNMRIIAEDEAKSQEVGMEEETENNLVSSVEMDMRIHLILEKIDRFTQQVSEILEAGKTMFQELSAKFEERLIEIHTTQIENWQDEIKELRLLDASNEATNALLQSTRSHLLENCHMDI